MPKNLVISTTPMAIGGGEISSKNRSLSAGWRIEMTNNIKIYHWQPVEGWRLIILSWFDNLPACQAGLTMTLRIINISQQFDKFHLSSILYHLSFHLNQRVIFIFLYLLNH